MSERVFSRTSDIIEADVGGEIVLLHTGNWQYFEFDAVGAAIWSLLESPRSLGSLVDVLVNRFEVDRARCAHETEAFLGEMMEQGLITAGDA